MNKAITAWPYPSIEDTDVRTLVLFLHNKESKKTEVKQMRLKHARCLRSVNEIRGFDPLPHVQGGGGELRSVIVMLLV